MFEFLARTVIDHPWRTIVLWAVAVVVAILVTPSLSTYTTANQQQFLPAGFESAQAQTVGNRYFPAQSGGVGSLVVTRTDGRQLTSSDQSTAAALATTLQNAQLPGVLSVQTNPKSLSSDGRVMAIQVAFDGQPGDPAVDDGVAAVRTAAADHLEGTALTSGLTGNAAVQVDSTSAYGQAENIITIATVVLILGLLLLIFRSPIIAILPLVVIGIVLRVVTGVTAGFAAGLGFEVSTSLQPILVVVLFGVGTDYIVFLLFRYRAHLREGEPHRQALLSASTAVGKVVGSSALTVIGAFAALLLAKLGSLNTMAPGLIVAVAAMLVTALTLIPAIFALLGPHLFWPRGVGRAGAPRPFALLGSLTARRPAVMGGSVAGGLIVLGAFAGGYQPIYNTLSELPSSTPAQVAYNTMSGSFPAGTLSPTHVYVQGEQPLSQGSLSAAAADLSGVAGVASVAPPAVSQDGTAALITVILDQDPFSNSALDLVEGPLRSAAHGSVPGAAVYVGGQTSTMADVRAQLHSDTRVVFPVAGAIILLILAGLLTALLAPLNLLACVGLTFAATLGAVVLVFQHAVGHPGIDFTIPIVLYLFVVAIGTDYNILIAARLHEEYRRGHTPRESVRIAVGHDAPTAAAAGAILALTFASLMLTGIANLVELGFGVAIGVAFAAFGMAPILVPSLSRLQGRAFWWPTRAPAQAASGPAGEELAGPAAADPSALGGQR